MNLKNYNRSDLDNFAQSRPGEVRLRDSIQLAGIENLKDYARSFVILGIPEDIGVRANLGIGGAHTLWPSFLSSLLSMQSNTNLNGQEIILLGELQIDREQTVDLSAEALRGLTSLVDESVAPIVLDILRAGHIPIIIGGGHNNAYPIIQACASYAGHAIATLNMDLHHDFRVTEGRHSGNPFRYAMEEGFLDLYLMWGLSKYYSQQSFLEEWASNDQLFAVFYETLLMNSFEANNALLSQYIQTLNQKKIGLEVDMDSVENMLSSAMTPSGFSPKEIRAYVSIAAQYQPWYLHICEGVRHRDDGLEDTLVAKMVALLVADFIHQYKNHPRI